MFCRPATGESFGGPWCLGVGVDLFSSLPFMLLDALVVVFCIWFRHCFADGFLGGPSLVSSYCFKVPALIFKRKLSKGLLTQNKSGSMVTGCKVFYAVFLFDAY